MHQDDEKGEQGERFPATGHGTETQPDAPHDQGYQVYRDSRPDPPQITGIRQPLVFSTELSREQNSVENSQDDRNAVGDDLQETLPSCLVAECTHDLLIKTREGTQVLDTLLADPIDMRLILLCPTLYLIQDARLQDCLVTCVNSRDL